MLFCTLESCKGKCSLHPIVLQDLARKLASFGMCPEATSMFVKAGEIQKAVDTCIYLNHVSTPAYMHICVLVCVAS